jgi:hypothetical protein
VRPWLTPCYLEPHPDWPHSVRYETYARVLEDTDAANLAAIPRKQRAMARTGGR